MKKLIVHAGTHKTATTSFQKICFENREKLAKGGILYPQLTFYPDDKTLNQTFACQNVRPESIPQHSFLPRFLLKDNFKDVSKFLKNALSTANRHSCETILLSGEDFESSLIDTSIALNLKDIAMQTGFNKVNFAITKRPSKDYFLSLYNQLATQRIPCNAISLYETINSHGYASFSSMHGVFHYVFDLFRAVNKFEKDTSIDCKILDFSEFLDVHPGYHFLESINPRQKKKIENLSINKIKSNTSLEKGNIEFMHACAFLSMNASQDAYKKHERLFQSIIERRKITLHHAMKLVEKNFQRFDEIPE